MLTLSFCSRFQSYYVILTVRKKNALTSNENPLHVPVVYAYIRMKAKRMEFSPWSIQ